MEAEAHRNFENALGRMPGGARISVGLATVQSDLDAFLDFCQFLLKEGSEKA
jgi:selenocysteine lyase/cysteine desulfurase